MRLTDERIKEIKGLPLGHNVKMYVDDLLDTIEALQIEKENFVDKCLESMKENADKSIRIKNLEAALRKAREALSYCAHANGISKPHWQVAKEAIAAIDRVLEGEK